MSKAEGRYNTNYLNLLAFHRPLYNMLASSMLIKEHPNEKKKKKKENKHLDEIKFERNQNKIWTKI